ncbi:MAG: hypothetical protein JWN86_4092 [Planctomycetota bacterium]|nr:hypothetical protein [Planctomycetota bacterium]
MRDRHVRWFFVVLILALPMAIDAVSGPIERPPDTHPAATSARASFDTASSWRVQGIQCVLLVGLTVAGRERKRLEARLSHAEG